MFEVLMQIYQSQGYSARDAAGSIVENNIYGLDIDKRAAQLAYFAVMMKARQYDRRFLTREIKPHVFNIEESNSINKTQFKYLGARLSETEKNKAITQLDRLLYQLQDAKEFGSILEVDNLNWDLLYEYVKSNNVAGQLTIDSVGIDETQDEILKLIDVGKILANKYDIAITNPPYMGGTGMDTKLIDFVKEKYDKYKTDLYSVFIRRCETFTKNKAFFAMITQHGWMFLSSFEKMRDECLKNCVINMTHLGARAFDERGGEVVQTVSFVFRKGYCDRYQAKYVRLVDYSGENNKKYEFSNSKNYYTAIQNNFMSIPGHPYAYWSSKSILNAFSNANALSDIAEPRQGVKTLNNELFLKMWFEVAQNKVFYNCASIEESVRSKKKWFPYNKGGTYRKWYGNNDYLVNWENDGKLMKALAVKKYHSVTRTITNISYFFKPGLTWSSLSSGNISLRAFGKGYIFDSKGSSMYFKMI